MKKIKIHFGCPVCFFVTQHCVAAILHDNMRIDLYLNDKTEAYIIFPAVLMCVFFIASE